MQPPISAFSPHLPKLRAARITLRNAAVTLAFGLAALAAQADDHADVAELMRSGRQAEALTRIEQFLQTRPRDAQMRFFKGLIQRTAGQLADALTTFRELTQDFPELPEPYNNLAVIHALQNDLDKARLALEMALRNNPNFALAHENLGDVLSRQARQAYLRAQQLGGGAGLSSKLEALRPLATPPSQKN